MTSRRVRCGPFPKSEAALLRYLQLLFWSAVALTLFFTLRPIVVRVPSSDKTQHLITFGILALLAASAYPRARLIALAAALSGFGGMIEVIQPWFGRSDDIRDWIADTLGILLAMVLVWTLRRRHR